MAKTKKGNDTPEVVKRVKHEKNFSMKVEYNLKLQQQLQKIINEKPMQPRLFT